MILLTAYDRGLQRALRGSQDHLLEWPLLGFLGELKGKARGSLPSLRMDETPSKTTKLDVTSGASSMAQGVLSLSTGSYTVLAHHLILSLAGIPQRILISEKISGFSQRKKRMALFNGFTRLCRYDTILELSQRSLAIGTRSCST